MLNNISIEEACDILLKEHVETRLIELPLLDSLGHVLAEDIKSRINMPPFDRAPLDGYAYKSEDTVGATEDSPAVLNVIDSIQAGYVSRKVIKNGEAIRIMTGAKIPEGADVIIRYEDTEFTDTQVKIFNYLKPRTNIVNMGEDIRKGDLVLQKGMVIEPPEIGVLAALGRSLIMVMAKPRVAVISTGDELISVDESISEGKIRNSNSYTIAAQVKRLGAEAVVLGFLKDNAEDMKRALQSALKWADMIVTTGGASAGDADITKDAFESAGAELLFWRVKMKPGSPIIAAKHSGRFLFGLSGNPAASYITFERFVRPVILRLMGKTSLNVMKVNSVLEDSFVKVSRHDRFVRAFTYKRGGRYYTKLPDKHSSGVLSSLIGKNSLFRVAGGTGPYKKGDSIEVEFMYHPEEEE